MQPFVLKGTYAPMTAAERQRRCRANGKGWHRGKRYTRAEFKAILAAQSRTRDAEQMAVEGQPRCEAQPTREAQPMGAIMPVEALPLFEWNLSAMAA